MQDDGAKHVRMDKKELQWNNYKINIDVYAKVNRLYGYVDNLWNLAARR